MATSQKKNSLDQVLLVPVLPHVQHTPPSDFLITPRHPTHLVLSLFGGNMEGGVHIFGSAVHLGAVLQQQHNNVDVAKS